MHHTPDGLDEKALAEVYSSGPGFGAAFSGNDQNAMASMSIYRWVS